MTKTNGRGSRLKRVLLVLAAVAATVVSTVAGAGLWLYTGADVSTVGKVDFRNELLIPPLEEGEVQPDGTRVFRLGIRAGETEFRPGQPTPTWGFTSPATAAADRWPGTYLGPTLRAERGEKVRVEVANRLDEPSTVHWHGMHLPAAMDGGPHQMVDAGGAWEPHWPVDQPAATLWYHPHPHGGTERHVQRGLAGMFLVDDAPARQLGLPDEYGVNDLPVVVQDVRFNGARFDHGHRFLRNTGFLGDETMVNGTLAPYREVRDELVRLRLLNASTARVYDFGLADDRAFDLVATDGGLLGAPHRTDRLPLSPGERAEILVRMAPGERTVLRSSPPGGGDFWQSRFSGGDDSFDVLELRAADTLRPAPDVPARLADVELPDPADASRERHFDLRMSGINGAPMAMDRIDATVERGATEVWTVRNRDGVTHNFHVHDVQFRVLAVDGEPPPPELRGRKDTVYVPSGREVKIALRFDGPPDPDVPYMYHCHLLSHEDGGMMGQFVVVEPGGAAGRVPGGSGGHAGH
ncbi:multicopper oxidase family protein [Streptomyces synnematoformans]|uniref:Multicopper oxidase domain-containing protein n=1 Tax=Streptomyces synnematoformans TaxID=415721 RepID=A0ABN2YJK6_9ACTN